MISIFKNDIIGFIFDVDQSPYLYTKTLKEPKRCPHYEEHKQNCMFCPKCGKDLKEAPFLTTVKTLRPQFHLDEAGRIYYGKFVIEKEDHGQYYIAIPVERSNLESLKDALTALESIAAEMKGMGIQGKSGVVHLYFDDI